MRKPLTPIAAETPTMGIPPQFGKRTKRTQSAFVLPTRASKRQRTGSDMSNKWFEQQPTCGICNKKNKTDRLIKCVGNCSNQVHPSCLPPRFGKKNDQNYQCEDCQKCCVCENGFPDVAKLLKCYLCFTCYHATCYRPNSGEAIRLVKGKRFCCSSCLNSQKPSPTKQKTPTPTKQKTTTDKVVRGRVGSLLPAVAEASLLDSSEEFYGFSQAEVPPLPRLLRSASAGRRPKVVNRRSKSVGHSYSIRNQPNPANTDRSKIDGTNTAHKDRNIIGDKEDIPDASAWTAVEVYEHFKKIFPRHAHVFEDEDIDGQALYKLQRTDVVGLFKLKIGPSIRVYDEILKMQKHHENQL